MIISFLIIWEIATLIVMIAFYMIDIGGNYLYKSFIESHGIMWGIFSLIMLFYWIISLNL